MSDIDCDHSDTVTLDNEPDGFVYCYTCGETIQTNKGGARHE